MVVCVYFFSCFFFPSVLARRFNSRSPVWGVVGFLCRWRYALAEFSLFFSNFWSQICARLSTSARHALPSCVSRRPPPLLPEASVVSVAGAQHVVLTHQGAFALWLRVKATLCLFRPCMAAPGVYGVGSSARCFRWQHVSYTHRHSGKVGLFAPLSATFSWVFSAFVFVYSPYFPGIICLCIAQILLKFLLARC
jgi:hypothetical protein